MKPYVLMMLVMGCGAASAVAADEAPDWERYEIVVQRNMFSPKRQPPTPAASTSEDEQKKTDDETAESRDDQSRPEKPGSHYVLVGTSLVGDHRIAFCEDRRDGRLIRLIPDQTLASFIVKDVTLDAVVFERDGEPMKITVGHTLAGEVPAPAATSVAASSPVPESPDTTSSASISEDAAEAPADDSQRAILERLRRRREQELQQ